MTAIWKKRPSWSESTITQAMLLAGAAVLAVHPLLWLFGSWFDASYNSWGEWAFAAVACVFLWSLTSPVCNRNREKRRTVLALLLVSGTVRMIGQILAVNVIIALPLILDVYALGLLTDLENRMRAVSPVWLAAAFVFALPLERLVQRLFGYGLQLFSARTAGWALKLFHEEASSSGTRILLAGNDILVDLPCSGARGAVLLTLTSFLIMAVTRPRKIRYALFGLGTALLSCVLVNTVRIAILSVGLAYPDSFGGVDVSQSPWHDIVGLFSLALGAVPLITLYGFLTGAGAKETKETSRRSYPTIPIIRKLGPKTAVCFLICALVVVHLPGRPIDVCRASRPFSLPRHLGNWPGVPVPLTVKEQSYFLRYGGHASKTKYGPHTVLLVRTSAPLRHLHTPDECLRGLGLAVDYHGQRRGFWPSAVYRAKSPNGDCWRVAVTYFSEDGQIAANISKVIWRWVRSPRTDWTAVQRISPLSVSQYEFDLLDRHLALALELPVPGDHREDDSAKGSDSLNNSNTRRSSGEGERSLP